MREFQFSAYDAGLLNDFGGGNVEWWQDYIRAEIGRAEEHCAEQFLQAVEERERMLEEAAEVLRELVDLMEDVRDGGYKPDSFTCQPARAFLAKLEARDA